MLLLTVGCGAWAGDPRACARMAEDAARLACYDALFGRHPDAATASVPTAKLPAGVPPAGTSSVAARGTGTLRDPITSFGDRGQLPATKRIQADLPKRVEFRISKVEPLADSLYSLSMDNGQVWVTREVDWALEFKSGEVVTIQRMVLGAFRISHPGEGRNVSVARIL